MAVFLFFVIHYKQNKFSPHKLRPKLSTQTSAKTFHPNFGPNFPPELRPKLATKSSAQTLHTNFGPNFPPKLRPKLSTRTSAQTFHPRLETQKGKMQNRSGGPLARIRRPSFKIGREAHWLELDDQLSKSVGRPIGSNLTTYFQNRSGGPLAISPK